MLNHGSVRLLTQLDRMLRLFVVTPDMHRVHHSIDRRETDSNFGFNVPWWDHLFGAYRDQPALEHDRMIVSFGSRCEVTFRGQPDDGHFMTRRFSLARA